MKQFSFKIGGPAGKGIMTTGLVFIKFAARSGFFTYDFVEYPSLIRGGHNTFYGTISKNEVFSTYKAVDFLIALNKETVTKHQEELNSKAGVIFDPNQFKQEKFDGVNLYPVPLLSLAERAGNRLTANTVALGAIVYLVRGNLNTFNLVLEDVFADKSEKIITVNQKAARLGYDYCQENFSVWHDFFTAGKEAERMVIAGNEAIALGSIAAGMKFSAIYPMTPISSILTFLAAHEKNTGIVLRQPEDEIAGISMAVGASFAGVRSMVATSGGGFALMNETLSLAGITETPVVVVFGQRAGPATGIPTWTAQEDLLYALTAAQGEYPRILLAPGDVEECFYLTAQAFNLAEIYQAPVIILVDKFVCEAHKTVGPFDLKKVKIDRGKAEKTPKLSRHRHGAAEVGQDSKTQNGIFPRYKVTEDGISPRFFPGKGVIVKANSDEHDQFGLSDESLKTRNAQVRKRMRKTKKLIEKMPDPRLYGPQDADLTIVGWGSTKGPILEALSAINNKQLAIKANFLHLNWLRPFPSKTVKNILKKAKKILLIENNYQGQLGQWIRMQIGFEIKDSFLKYDGRQFYPEEIREKIESIFS